MSFWGPAIFFRCELLVSGRVYPSGMNQRSWMDKKSPISLKMPWKMRWTKGDGFRYVLFPPRIRGEMIHFDKHIFQMDSNHQLDPDWLYPSMCLCVPLESDDSPQFKPSATHWSLRKTNGCYIHSANKQYINVFWFLRIIHSGMN